MLLQILPLPNAVISPRVLEAVGFDAASTLLLPIAVIL